VQVYFADSSSDRGQARALLGAGIRDFLLSYHYAAATPWMEPLWEEILKIYLAAWPTQEIQKGALIEAEEPHQLLSYAEKRQEADYGEVWDEFVRINHERRGYSGMDLRARVMIDSGAFTAWSTGRPIALEEYAEWILRFKAKWEDRLASLHFISLDVIGDQRASWKNQAILEDHYGLDTIPVLHHDATRADLDRAFGSYDFICVGGGVPLMKQKAKLQAWFDRVFHRALQVREERGYMPRVHLLGVTRRPLLERYPIFSSDSSSWTAPLRFGQGRAAQFGKRIPRYTLGENEHRVNILALREEIRKLKDLERDVTELWRRRGITWDG
jgi:hypothetical protein